MKKKVLKVLFVTLLISFLAFGFYWFQIKPSNERQKKLESQIEALQKQVKSQRNNTTDNSDEVDRLKNQVQDMQDSIIQARQDAEDEANNAANCENNGGRYQGNGMCIYY